MYIIILHPRRARPARAGGRAQAHDDAAFLARITRMPCVPSSVSFARLRTATHTIGVTSTPFTWRAGRRGRGAAR